MRGIVACSTDNILPIALAEVAIGEVSWPFACHNGSTKSDWMGNRSSWHFLQPNARNGFASFCALTLGWTYAWIVGLPVILLSFLLRVLHSLPKSFRKKMAGCESSREKQIVHVAILLLVSLVIYPACLCVKPAEIWKEWNGRQYRVKSVDGIVHVQIREDGKIADVSSDASSYHRFHVEPASAEELLFMSSDVGTRIIQKVDDNWIMQDSKIGDLNRLNTR